MAKTRTPVPQEVSAGVLFTHDHTCCVCREQGKQVQIHHIDGDPTNHSPTNLSVLCFEDHNRTLMTGGFGRSLRAEEIHQYRDDWLERVKRRREEADRIASLRQAGITETPRTAAILERTEEQARPAEIMLRPYIEHLPELRRAIYEKARPGWAGSNADMKIATYEVIDVLERVLVHLASWFPEGHFGGKRADLYFSASIAERSVWHRALNEPDGPDRRHNRWTRNCGRRAQ